MKSVAASIPFPRHASIPFAFLLAALAMGSLTPVNPKLAAGLVVAAVLAVLVIARVTVVPGVLVLAMFAEGVSIGPGLGIGRLGGVLALTVIAYYLVIHGRAGLRANALIMLSGAYGLWTLSSVYWSEFPALAYETTFRCLLAFAYALAFALIVRTKDDVAGLFATFAIGALVLGAAAFAGYATAPETYNVEGSARGLTGDHNYFAGYQVLALPAALAVAAYDRRGTRTSLYYLAVGAIVLSVVASLSRSGLIALLGVVFLTLLLPWRYFFRRATHKVVYVATLGFAAAVVSAAGASAFMRRALTIFEEEGPTGARGSGRMDIWRAAVTGFREDPLLGLGAGNFRGRSFDLLQATPGVNSTAGYQSVKGKYVHNMFLGNLTELGIIGFTLFTLVMVLTLWYLVRSFRRARAARDAVAARFIVAVLVSFFAFGITGMFLSVELSKALWIIVGLALAFDVMTRRYAVAPARAARASRSTPRGLAAPRSTPRRLAGPPSIG